jgi:hypothetical protein
MFTKSQWKERKDKTLPYKLAKKENYVTRILEPSIPKKWNVQIVHVTWKKKLEEKNLFI